MKALIGYSGIELVGNLMVADSILTRMKGLLGRDSLPYGWGLWLKPCKGVHTFGMKFAIDVVFLDRDNCVIKIISGLKPNRMTAVYPQAATVLELPSSTVLAVNLTKGDVVDFKP